jgi:hypothetical protein
MLRLGSARRRRLEFIQPTQRTGKAIATGIASPACRLLLRNGSRAQNKKPGGCPPGFRVDR